MSWVPTPHTIWPDPSQAISSPEGQEAGVGSRKSGRSCVVGRGTEVGGTESIKAINPPGEDSSRGFGLMKSFSLQAEETPPKP